MMTFAPLRAEATRFLATGVVGGERISSFLFFFFELLFRLGGYWEETFSSFSSRKKVTDLLRISPRSLLLKTYGFLDLTIIFGTMYM